MAGAALGSAPLAASGIPSALAAPQSETAGARLSLNENPFGPSPLAIGAIRDELASVERYTAGKGDALAAQIGAP